MDKIRITRSLQNQNACMETGLKLCLPVNFVLESGETIRRGCGSHGLYKTEVGWHCFYCGNYLYLQKPSIKSLWFHFKVGREYWRTMFSRDRIFINGLPVAGLPDSLPGRLVSDLLEPAPPSWFSYFIFYDGTQFKQYMENYKYA